MKLSLHGFVICYFCGYPSNNLKSIRIAKWAFITKNKQTYKLKKKSTFWTNNHSTAFVSQNSIVVKSESHVWIIALFLFLFENQRCSFGWFTIARLRLNTQTSLSRLDGALCKSIEGGLKLPLYPWILIQNEQCKVLKQIVL